MRIGKPLTGWLLGICALALGSGFCAAGLLVWRYGAGLPDHEQLAGYRPPVVSRVHAGDGRLLAEFAREKRVFVPIAAIPHQVVQAFVSAEDKTFFRHPGIDLPGILNAGLRNRARREADRRPVGASTITQQVARNFLLTNVVSYERKIKEIILAFRIERALPKRRILELYLNQIYLGRRSWGVAAAALNYFDKSMDDLTLAEAAFLAGLPKAPNNYDPDRHPEAARARRDYVLRRMQEDGHVSAAQAAQARAGPVTPRPARATEIARAGHFVAEIRRRLVREFGEDGLYGGGLSVRTTLDPRLQQAAEKALRAGLIAYDRRHGWRGPLARGDPDRALAPQLAGRVPADLPAGWVPAVVAAAGAAEARIRLADGAQGRIPLAELRWARRRLPEQRLGRRVGGAAEVLSPGDLVLVERLAAAGGGGAAAGPDPIPAFGLRQIPDVDGALVALDPHTGRVLALSGGFSFAASKFDRATQAWRQPGSAFKPVVYLAALDRGFGPSSLILDAPFVVDQGHRLGKWKPANYGGTFHGPSTMRLGIERSRNLMTVRLARRIGMETVAAYAERLGVAARMPPLLSMALGAGETTLLRLTAAYAMLVNGGKRVVPAFIDRVQDRQGKTVYRHDRRACRGCAGEAWHGQDEPVPPDDRPQAVDPRSAYQIVSMLEGAVRRGTGRPVGAVGKPLAGKTGTTDRSFDCWFVGFSPDLAAGVYVGFDAPRTLGHAETGASAAAPIFRDFMAEALAGAPAIPFRIPPGIRLVRVDARSGRPAPGGGAGTILEAFKPGGEPVARAPRQDGGPNRVAPARPRDLN